MSRCGKERTYESKIGKANDLESKTIAVIINLTYIWDSFIQGNTQ